MVEDAHGEMRERLYWATARALDHGPMEAARTLAWGYVDVLMGATDTEVLERSMVAYWLEKIEGEHGEGDATADIRDREGVIWEYLRSLEREYGTP